MLLSSRVVSMPKQIRNEHKYRMESTGCSAVGSGSQGVHELALCIPGTRRKLGEDRA